MTALAFAGLAFPVALGAMTGVAALFADPAAAIRDLNRYALYIAFPALIVAGLTDAAFEPPAQPWFWAVIPIAIAITVATLRLAASRVPQQVRTLAISAIFGNVAYVGLPLCVSVLGAAVLGTTSLAVSVFVLSSLLLGPTLLIRWTPGAATDRSPWMSVARQPLFWAPFVGLGLRLLPDGALSTLHSLMSPVGASAAPVALFLLGLYLWENRSRLAHGGGSGVAHVLGKMVVFPAVMLACVLAARRLGWADDQAARIVLILSATPTAIATFALAQEFEVGADSVATAIVGSTLLAALSLPAAVALILQWIA